MKKYTMQWFLLLVMTLSLISCFHSSIDESLLWGVWDAVDVSTFLEDLQREFGLFGVEVSNVTLHYTFHSNNTLLIEIFMFGDIDYIIAINAYYTLNDNEITINHESVTGKAFVDGIEIFDENFDYLLPSPTSFTLRQYQLEDCFIRVHSELSLRKRGCY